MKRFLILFVALVSLTACATTGENQTPIVEDEAAQDAIITITARNLAFAVGRNNPKILDPAIAFCAGFAGAELVDLEPMIEQGLKYLDVEVKDYPMLGEDLKTLLTLFNIKILNDPNIPLTPRQVAMVKIAAVAMKQGFEYAKANPKGA